MFDFVRIDIKAKDAKNTKFEVYPEFLVRRSKDLMVRGKAFYAVWDEEKQLWTQDENYISTSIDTEIRKVVKEAKEKYPYATVVTGAYLGNFSSNKWTEWQKYIKSLPDNYHELDTEITFANANAKKTDYISKRLPYDLVDADCPAYNELMDILYDPEERKKLEWAIGAIISGDSKRIQKFIVLYGPPKSGKSTFLKIVQKLFEGYYSTFEAKALGSVNNPFALEAFKDNPLLVIQHDGDLSKIEDNTKLNQIISHEELIVNEKYKATYATSFNSFLMLGTNKPVKITDAKSGIVRRLIDVEPTGETASYSKYRQLMSQINFELGAIANHCLQLYSEMGENYYDSYKPLKMIGATNVVYNFLEDNYFILKEKDEVLLAELWNDYKRFCEEGNQYKMSKTSFKEELRSYFKEFIPHTRTSSNVYVGFKKEKFIKTNVEDDIPVRPSFQFNKRTSLFDEVAKDFPAQYAKEDESPETYWDEITTTTKDLDTSRLHYIRVPKEYIVIDFDLKDENGNKSFEKNLKAANEWPPTYAELSKSGAGIHLHYIYDGDVTKLNSVFADGIEVKVYTGKSALRRKLTKCNDIPIATISSGLPLKEEKKMVDFENVKNEKHLRSLIFKNLNKQIHPGTKPSVDFIYKILDDAYNSGMIYDVSDLQPDILAFANNSTNHGSYCVNLVHKMKFKSEQATYDLKDMCSEINKATGLNFAPIAFFDIEVFPNLFLVNWKYAGEDKSVVRLINPTVSEIVELCKLRLIGFNNRRYDNHILYARIMGYNNAALYELSQRIISGDKNAFFREAYNLSYTDVYDFSNTKQSLKKWEIALGIKHKELGLPWDQPVPEDMWEEVAAYCDNDVIATEAVFNHLHEDWTARQILALISGLTVNDTTNAHTTRIIVGDEKNPQSQFVYTDLSEIFPGYEFDAHGIDISRYNEGTKIVAGKSIYWGEDPGEGGYVYAEPGMYKDVALLDIASMHPNSARNMNIFGPYQERYNALIDARLGIKHKEFEEALKQLLFINPNVENELRGYLSDAGDTKAMAYALKIPINSVYGLTSAKFENKLKDPRNIDNIVAKRGALFMINLKHEVQNRGFTVAHIKTDSIKIPNATPEIIQFVFDYGKQYGYTFEHEATYKKMCLVNDAVYVAQYDNGEWTATGAEFQHPYIFKKLFSKEPIEFADYCETKSVQKGDLYLDMNEGLPEDEHKMVFVGRVGSFVPIEPGKGGGTLYRVQDEKNYAATGTKGWRWLEAETVMSIGKQNDICMEYFDKLCDDAIEHISQFGDFERFVNDPDYDPSIEKYIRVPEGTDNEVPFEEDFMNKPTV